MLAVRPLLSPRPSLLPPPPPPPPPPLPSPPRSSRPRLAALRLAARPTPDRFYLAAASSLYRLLSLSTPPTDSSLCAPRAVSSLRRGGGSTTQLGQQRRTCSNYSERATKADVISFVPFPRSIRFIAYLPRFGGGYRPSFDQPRPMLLLYPDLYLRSSIGVERTEPIETRDREERIIVTQNYRDRGIWNREKGIMAWVWRCGFGSGLFVRG